MKNIQIRFNELLVADMLAGRAACSEEQKADLLVKCKEHFVAQGVSNFKTYLAHRAEVKKKLRELPEEIRTFKSILRRETSLADRAEDASTRCFHQQEAATADCFLFSAYSEYRGFHDLRRLGKAWSAIAFAKTEKVEPV